MARTRLILGGGTATAAVAVAGVLLLGGSPDVSGATPRVGGCKLFGDWKGGANKPAAGSLRAFNQPVARSHVHRRSKRYLREIRALGGNQSLHPDFGSNTDWGIPYRTVPAGQPRVNVTIGPDGFPAESDFGPAPIPPDAPVEGGEGSDGDRHVLVVERGRCHLYELYRAFYEGGAWQADSTAGWNLRRSRLQRPAGWTSADAAGLPILPGLVRYDEVRRGRVRHAIRATFERTRRSYIHPARHWASDRCARYLPPMGLRLRLRRSYYRRHRSDFPPGSQSRPIFKALFRFGLIVADNGSNWFFTGASDSRWDDDDLGRLKGVPGSAFVAVRSKARERTPC